MKKNCIFIKDLGILEPLNYQINGPLNCYIDFGGNSSVNATITFSCAEFDGKNYTSIVFPKKNAQGGLPNYGSFDLSSSHEDIIGNTPIINNLTANKEYVLKDGQSKSLTFSINLTIDKATHLSTNSTKKNVRLRYIPLEASNLHNGFYAGYNPDSINYQSGLFRRDSNIIGLPYLELSFYIYEKPNTDFSTYIQEAGIWATPDTTLKEIIFLKNNFVSSSGTKKGKIAFSTNGTGFQTIHAFKLDSQLNRVQSISLTSEIIGGTTVYKVPVNQSVFTIIEVVFGSLTNNLDVNSKKEQSVFLIFTYTAKIWSMSSSHKDLKDFIIPSINVPLNNINIIENLVSDPIITKGNTIINCIPTIDKGNVKLQIYLNENEPAPVISLDSSSSDEEYLNAANLYYDIECQLKLNSKILETRKGFGNIVYTLNGSIDKTQSKGHEFLNLIENPNNYQVSYIFTLKNTIAY